ncbi:MAG: CPBP family intramembrane metalloprotease [Verrucomicrobia bacterium]|nr:CPBP family intramembrane metalloprotease [Verrucomicrobiota bacterium]MBS0645891.1 CPBP family intramembrane metalloprotease [Verrucomicrobiota bacterium]
METWSQRHLVISVTLFFVLAIAMTAMAFRYRYFSLPERSTTAKISWKQVVGAFGTYLLITLLFYPIMILLSQHASTVFKVYYDGWVQLAYTVALFLALMWYLFRICTKDIIEAFFGHLGLKGQLRSVGLGVLTWVLAYPWVFVVNLISDRIAHSIWGATEQEQTAVRHLKDTQAHPSLYFWTVMIVVFVVPVIEELLFRGFLQSWLRKFLGRIGALVVTAWIFSSVHYAPSQKSANFPLLCSLFVLSLFLGFLYERQRTLWAPIALHATFNASTVLLLKMSSVFGV